MSRALAGSRTPVTITAMSIKKTKRGIKRVRVSGQKCYFKGDKMNKSFRKFYKTSFIWSIWPFKWILIRRMRKAYRNLFFKK